MAIAVINHDDLVAYAEQIGFPKYTKVKLESQGCGYQMFDKFIRDSVRWISQIDFDPASHIRIGESADHINLIHDLWTIRSQRFLEGTEEHNSFQKIVSDEGTSFSTHVNREAIREAVVAGRHRYQIQYDLDEDGSTITHDYLNVAIFDTAEDSSLVYTSQLPIEQVHSLKVEMLSIENNPVQVPTLYRRPYVPNYNHEERYEWEFVGYLTDDEYAAWCLYNPNEDNTLESLAATDFRGIDERVVATMKATMGFADTVADVKKGSAHLAS